MSNSRRSMAHMIMKDRMPGIRFLSQSKYFFFIQILYVLLFHSANIGQAGRNQVLWTLHYCWTLRSEMLESCKLRCCKQPSIEISPTTTVRYFDDHVQDEYFNTIFTFSSSFWNLFYKVDHSSINFANSNLWASKTLNIVRFRFVC